MSEDKAVLPLHWEKRVLAAYFLMMGETWESTARKVGRSHDTIARWKRAESWAHAKTEAERRWLYDVKDVARRAVYSQVHGGDGDLGLKVLERLEPALAPKQEHRHRSTITVTLEDRLTKSLAAVEKHRNGAGHPVA